MKHSTRFTVLVACILISFHVTAQNVLIPDSNFKSALVNNSQINRNRDGEIQVSEASAFTGTINVPNLNIQDLTGVEAFTSLTRLYVNNNMLSSINLSANTMLVALRCNNNSLTALDVSNNTRLTELRFYLNQITAIDLSMLTMLQVLQGSQNQLSTIDLSHSSSLRELKIDFNQLTELDLNANTALTYLDCKQNNLTTLKLRNGNNSNVTYFNAIRNTVLLCIEVDDPAYSENNWHNVEPVSEFKIDCDNANQDIVNIPDAAFKAVLVGRTEININGDQEIQVTEAERFGGSIFAAKKNISDLTGVEAFTRLRELHVYENNISTIDVTHNAELRVLRFNNNPVASIDVSHNPHLTSLMAHKTSIASLNLSANPELTKLWCFDSQLSSLDVSGNAALVDLQVNHNHLSTLTLGSHPSLVTLLAYQNQLTSLDISGATSIQDLRVQQNKLTAIDIRNHSSLRSLNVGDNMITSLDLTGKPGITLIWCYNNLITELDASTNPNLFSFLAYKNKLTVLNVKSGNNTQLREFDVTRNPNLRCIQVDDPAWSEANWTKVDANASFNADCGYGGPAVVNIPDANFRARLFYLGVDTNNDSQIQYSEAEAVTDELNLEGASIVDPTGIEAFINVQTMNWEENDVVRLDLRRNTALRDLSCAFGDLNELWVNPQLERLSCFSNYLTSLATLQNNNSLKELDISFNQVTGFNLSEFQFATTLQVFTARSNPLHGLDLSAGTSLTSVTISGATVPSINLSTATNLNLVSIFENPQLEFINLNNGSNSIEFFNVQHNPVLTCVEVNDVAYSQSHYALQEGAHFSEDCGYSEPEVVNIPDANFRARLILLGIDTNHDEKIQRTEAEAVTGELNLDAAEIHDPTGIEAFINTVRMNWEHNDVPSLDVSLNTALRLLDCGYSNIESVQVGPGLQTLVCYSNRLTSLNLSNNNSLRYIDFSENNITHFDIDDYPFAPVLEFIGTSTNPLEVLDLKAGVNLTFVGISNALITSLDLSESHKLINVRMSDNLNLQTLNIRNGNNTNITEFDVQRHPSLTCVEVDDVQYADAHFEIEPQTHFSEDCDGSEAIVYIPDPIFKQKLLENDQINMNFDNEIQKSEANNYYGWLRLDNLGISDLTGIEEFINIEVLDVSENNLTRLLLDNHDRIDYLNASNNQINALSVYNCDYMTNLEVRDNRLESLLLPPRLEALNASKNLLSSINITAAPPLRHVTLNNNKLTKFDLTEANPYVDVLNVASNNLTWLNLEIAQRGGLGFAAKENNLTCIQVDDPAYAEANWRDDVDPGVTFNTHCEGDPEIVYIPDPNLKRVMLAALDGRSDTHPDNVPDGEVQYFEAAEASGGFSCNGQSITDLTGIHALIYVEYIDCSNNLLTDITDMNGATGLDCSNNQLTQITADISNLEYLNAINNKLTSLPANLVAFETEVDNNEITSLGDGWGEGISFLHLNRLSASGNKIAAVNFGSNVQVESLILNNNQLTSLDLSDMEELSFLNCSDNQLTSLKVKNVSDDPNTGMYLNELQATGNPDLACIEVDDVAKAEEFWRDSVDPQATFNTDCSASEALTISVSPNPTMGRLTIEGGNADEVVVFDGISGGLISRSQGNDLDISHLHSGVYLVKVRSGETVSTTRVVKK